jgi:selenocysteine lyase/cysteine desulfurase
VHALHAVLEAAGVSCVPREGAIRFAPHFYNTPGEMEHVVTILAEACAGA